MPLLVALKGHPGTGKSALSRTVGRELGWPVIDKDDDCADAQLDWLVYPGHACDDYAVGSGGLGLAGDGEPPRRQKLRHRIDPWRRMTRAAVRAHDRADRRVRRRGPGAGEPGPAHGRGARRPAQYARSRNGATVARSSRCRRRSGPATQGAGDEPGAPRPPTYPIRTGRGGSRLLVPRRPCSPATARWRSRRRGRCQRG